MPDDMPTPKKKKIPQTVIDIIIALAIVASIFLAMYAYTGTWPPLVVVESRSMQHSDSVSEIGVMDTGDLVLVKKINNASEIKTYYEGRLNGYATYGDFGDVIIYLRGGSTQFTPIIHRAVIYLQANADGNSFRAADLSNMQGIEYDFDNNSNTWYQINSDIILHSYGYDNQDLRIPIGQMIDEMKGHGIQLHDGFITKGDFNQQVDQLLGVSITREPIRVDWVLGVAVGEIPWFGIIKLWLTGDLPADTPANSIGALEICIIVIIAIPVSLEVFLWWRDKKKQAPTDEKKTENSSEQKEGPPTVTPKIESEPGKKMN